MTTLQVLLVLCVGALFSAEALLPLDDTATDLIRDPCGNFLCQNGGSCTAPADAPSCVCPAGYIGDHCEIELTRDPCSNVVCLNGGSCTAPADVPRCECRAGFAGDRCEKKIKPTCGPCPPGWKCKFDPDVVCVTAPCFAYTCVPPVTIDHCGPCPAGWTCKYDPNVVCVKAPCFAFTCVPPVIPVDRCGGCPPGKTCTTIFPPCPAPPEDCEDGLLPRLRRRSIPCSKYRCEPVHVCVGKLH